MSGILQHFGPRSTGLLILSFVLAVGLDVLTVALWDTGRMLITRRIVGLLLAQALIVLAAFLVVNRQFALYPTWSDLFGTGR